MRKFIYVLCSLLLGTVMPVSAQHRQVSVNGFGDNDKNQTYAITFNGIAKAHSSVLAPFRLETRWLSDSVNDTESNLKVSGGLRKLVDRWYLDGRMGADFFDNEVTPTGQLTIGKLPNWNTKHPFGANIQYNYDPYDYILAHALTGINTSRLSTQFEYYPLNKFGIILGGDLSQFTDGNRRETAELTLRWYEKHGIVLGAYGQVRTFETEELAYWSPSYYDLMLVQIGWRTKWDNPNYRANIIAGGGQQQIDSQTSTVVQLSSELMGRIKNNHWLVLNFMVSNGAGITAYNSNDYRWYTATIGYRSEF